MRNACLRHQVLVVLQEAAQSLLAAHFAIAATHPLFSRGEKQNIFFALMVSLSMVVLDERRYRSPQGRLAAQNQLRQAFLFYRSHPSLRECVQIRTPSPTVVEEDQRSRRTAGKQGRKTKEAQTQRRWSEGDFGSSEEAM